LLLLLYQTLSCNFLPKRRFPQPLKFRLSD